MLQRLLDTNLISTLQPNRFHWLFWPDGGWKLLLVERRGLFPFTRLLGGQNSNQGYPFVGSGKISASFGGCLSSGIIPKLPQVWFGI